MKIESLEGDHRGDEHAEQADVVAAQSLADVATIAIVQNRAALESHRVIEQLNGALNNRVTIEQAKGILAERTGLSMDQAFSRLRKQARDHYLRLLKVAQAVIDGSLAFPAPPPPPRRSRR